MRMDYRSSIAGRFLERPNRFIAHVEVDGVRQVAHVRNTGRCKEFLIPGATVYLEQAANPTRRTAYTLTGVMKGDRLINMDSQAPNKAVGEALASGWLPSGLEGPVADLRSEVAFRDSRLDFGFTAKGRPVLLEVKGVTLEEGGRVFFPDAPTLRGIKHLQELEAAKAQGLEAWVIFAVQMDDVDSFAPSDVTQPAFGVALRHAVRHGVEARAHLCHVTPGSIRLAGEIPILL